LGGRTKLRPSVNDYDWLGSGIYFWVDSGGRGLDWARELTRRKRARVKNPYAIGALIYPGLCLNLTDYGVMSELHNTYRLLEERITGARLSMPANTARSEGVPLYRTLDCAVINLAHQIRSKVGDVPYDTVYGMFEEGGEVYPGSGFRAKTHVQIAVRNPQCVVGYFRVQELDLAA
jgi:hypothetical protein